MATERTSRAARSPRCRDFDQEIAMSVLHSKHVLLGVVLATLGALSCASHAAIFRAYLSAHGNDSKPCTVSDPCRLLPAALNVVADGGEIWMVDSANFNTAPVSIA